MAKASVSENSRNRRPASPPMNSNGMKAAISETLIEMTVKPICRALSIAARIGGAPFSRLRNAFSIITMASSTTKPTETASAISDRLSIENPASHIAGASAGKRQRHRNADRDGWRQTAQEYEHHHHHQHDGGGERELHVVHAGADHQGAVRQHRKPRSRRHPPLEFGQEGLDAVDGLDHIGVGLLGDDDEHGRLAVEPGGRTGVAGALLDGGDR